MYARRTLGNMHSRARNQACVCARCRSVHVHARSLLVQMYMYLESYMYARSSDLVDYFFFPGDLVQLATT